MRDFRKILLLFFVFVMTIVALPKISAGAAYLYGDSVVLVGNEASIGIYENKNLDKLKGASVTFKFSDTSNIKKSNIYSTFFNLTSKKAGDISYTATVTYKDPAKKKQVFRRTIHFIGKIPVRVITWGSKIKLNRSSGNTVILSNKIKNQKVKVKALAGWTVTKIVFAKGNGKKKIVNGTATPACKGSTSLAVTVSKGNLSYTYTVNRYTYKTYTLTCKKMKKGTILRFHYDLGVLKYNVDFTYKKKGSKYCFTSQKQLAKQIRTELTLGTARCKKKKIKIKVPCYVTVKLFKSSKKTKLSS